MVNELDGEMMVDETNNEMKYEMVDDKNEIKKKLERWELQLKKFSIFDFPISFTSNLE